MDFLLLLPTLIQAASTIKSIIDIASSNKDIVSKIGSLIPEVGKALEEFGGQFFPKVKPQLHVAAAAMAAFDPDVTRWLQGGINVVLNLEPNLVVDGIYGPKTRAAVERLQERLGVDVDGWAGTLTRNALEAVLAKRAA